MSNYADAIAKVTRIKFSQGNTSAAALMKGRFLLSQKSKIVRAEQKLKGKIFLPDTRPEAWALVVRERRSTSLVGSRQGVGSWLGQSVPLAAR